MHLKSYFPILDWGRRYNRQTLTSDLVAAIIVTIMLIPQSLAYALLAGLPPEVGLYASVLPLVAYAIFGTSSALAVGPVAVASLMTAAAVGRIAAEGTVDYASAAIMLAFLSGIMLALMGLLRLGFVANFLSHPVISGFITASGIIIATSQIGGLLGIKTEGHAMPDLIMSIIANIGQVNWYTLAIGALALALLLWIRLDLKNWLARFGVPKGVATIVVRAGPVLVVFLTMALSVFLDLGARGVALVGDVPQGLPMLSLPAFDIAVIQQLAMPALIISIVGFVESISVAQTLAAKRRERISPNQELIGLGASNIAAAIGGGYPVTGGFARSVVNFDAGAATPAAGAFTAIGIAGATLLLTPFLAILPKATLAATIVLAVLTLVDFSILKRAWDYSKADFAAVAITLLGTLLLGVEVGISLGVGASILVFLYRSSQPHAAIVGQVPGTEHYRNVKRHQVDTMPGVLSIRVDESLYFANARYLEDLVINQVAANPGLTDVVLMCSAVNAIDMSALESLEAIHHRLADLGVRLHLSEVKGPVMDRLAGTEFLDHLSGQVHLSHHQAMLAIADVRLRTTELRPEQTGT
ncbi:sulfate:proton symporter [Devosia limi DSM 17137]|uniref:Sulfate permease, SulP family n=1 Tax=Devosia limi DSM 17137 TaxID=1121477 RepID=A0A0F5LUZ8_9HYPH|nr:MULTISPECIES: sulfate permease [Devosia]MBU1334345.1 sulfate permease [Alphaproteobacteria bacterium]KKB86190.1 sulfate:proton symporter [Devosia limi DSM 17137]MBU1559689.1 sulfate permease [Alphaproteobacteria bacterium]MBU2305068.1 sulfate permease [Alphaproteobacteria bacterium]MBU2367873.1 sulfate permease [Alphaproteobacteria bacterium]